MWENKLSYSLTLSFFSEVITEILTFRYIWIYFSKFRYIITVYKTMLFNIIHEYIHCPYCKKKIRKDSLKCPYCTSDLTNDFAKKEMNKKSFLTGWKFWTWLLIIIFWVISISKSEPTWNTYIDPSIQKLQESRDFFYQTCMWWLTPESKGYSELDTSCRKWMEAIKNPEYKDLYSK